MVAAEILIFSSSVNAIISIFFPEHDTARRELTIYNCLTPFWTLGVYFCAVFKIFEIHFHTTHWYLSLIIGPLKYSF